MRLERLWRLLSSTVAAGVAQPPTWHCPRSSLTTRGPGVQRTSSYRRWGVHCIMNLCDENGIRWWDAILLYGVICQDDDDFSGNPSHRYWRTLDSLGQAAVSARNSLILRFLAGSSYSSDLTRTSMSAHISSSRGYGLYGILLIKNCNHFI